MRRLLLLLTVVLALLPGVARAHATVVASNPEPGQRLAAAPGLVALTFTEPLNTRLSRAAVTAPDGRRFEGAASGEREIQVRLATDASGVYAVEWTTVSIVDGHTLRGGFRFGVGVAPDPGAEDEPATAPGPAELLLAVARALEYVALLAAAGMLLHRRLAAGDPLLAWVRPRPRWALALALAAGCAVVVGEALIAAPAPSLASLADYVGGGLPGAARLARLAAEALALGLALVAPAVAALPLAVALVALAAAGHAAAVAPAWLGIAVDAGHLLAAGLWAGGILALATLRPPGGWRDTAARRLLGRFTPVALVAFPATVAAGVVRAVQELGDPGDLVSTSYGLVLNLKVLLVLAMVPLSLLAWRRREVAPRLEPALAVAVLGAAALLAAFPLPPGRLSEADEARARAVPEGALPQPGDLTLGGSVGDLVVGITLRPGGPGPNEALVHLVPLDGEDAAVGVPVELTVGPRSFATRACGPACRVTELELRGGERIEVRVAGGAAGGGTVAFDLPDLPAADGAALLGRAQRRMHALRAYRVRETLGPASPPSRGTYTFQAPDRMHLQASTGELVWIGQTQYRRDGRGGDWVVDRVGSAPEVPRFVWDGAGPPGAQEHVAPRLLGSARLGDVDTTVLAFFAELGRLPVWFRLWVDAEGLVHRAEMRARGHVMDQEYGDFDAPLAVEAPIAAVAGAPAVGGPPTPHPGTPSDQRYRDFDAPLAVERPIG